jgi:hypothetical protein
MRSLPKTCEPLDNQTLMALAKQRARVLRREAVPAFWENVDATVAQAGRSLSRYLRSLARHRKLRGHHVDTKAV